MSTTTGNTTKPTPSKDDELLEMFFDEEFVPQAYVDIFLTTINSREINEVQTMSSSLLARLDFYTKHLTKELESTIWNLEKLSETLPGTWSTNTTTLLAKDDETSDDKLDQSSTVLSTSSSTNLIGASKLEYYLDTLGSAVRSLETDVSKVDDQLTELDIKYKDSDKAREKLSDLKTIKKRLNTVLEFFMQLKTILDLSLIHI